MNQALKREIELAQYAALKGDAKSFFTHEERIFSIDVHNDAAPIDLLDKLRLIAALRADKFKTATEVWDAMKGGITKQDKIELWNHLLSAPEISDSDYTELIHIIVGDPNQKGSLLTNKMIWAVVILFIVLLGGGIIWETDLFDIKTRISNRFFEEGSDPSGTITQKSVSDSNLNPLSAPPNGNPFLGTPINAMTISDDFENNILAAETKYKSKGAFFVIGKVYDFREMVDEEWTSGKTYDVILLECRGIFDMRVAISGLSREYRETLNKGDEVTLRVKFLTFGFLDYPVFSVVE